MMTLLLLFALVALLTVAIPKVDQTANTIRKTQVRGRGSYIAADGVVVPVGMLAQLEGGYLNHYDGTATTGYVFLGIVVGGDDRVNDAILTGETSDTPPVEVRVDESGPVIMHTAVGGTPAQTDVGCLIYCADSNPANLTKTDTTKPPVGWLKRFRSTTDCDVQLFTPAEWLAGIASAAWLS